MNEDSIIHEILYPYPVWTVWRALTTSEVLAQWLMPNDFVAQVGHCFTFHVKSQHGWSGQVICHVVELSAPHRLSYTWQSGLDMLTTLVTFTLETVGNQTRLHLEHTGFAAGAANTINLRDLLDSGWGLMLQRGKLSEVLARLAAHS